MTTKEKEEKLTQLVTEILERSHKDAIKNIQKVIRSGAIDIESWDEKMVMPKTIATALLEEESRQWAGVGTKYESQVKKDVKNIRRFL